MLRLFIRRLARQHILTVLLVMLTAVLFLLSYRNILQADQLRASDRLQISSLKKEYQYASRISPDGKQTVSEEDRLYYQKVVELTTAYLEQEHVAGKSGEVLAVEQDIYEQLNDWLHQGKSVSQYTQHELEERLVILSLVNQKGLHYHYQQAPKDFYLLLVQVMPASNLVFPLLLVTLAFYLLFTDRQRHRGFWSLQGISTGAYAKSLGLLVFLLNFCLSTLLVFLAYLFSNVLGLSFQADYPVLVYGAGRAVMSATERLSQLGLSALLVSCLTSLSLSLLAGLLLKKK